MEEQQILMEAEEAEEDDRKIWENGTKKGEGSSKRGGRGEERTTRGGSEDEEWRKRGG